MDEPKPFIGTENHEFYLDGHKYRVLIDPVGLERKHGKHTVCVTVDDLRLIYQNYFDDIRDISENPLSWWTVIKL